MPSDLRLIANGRRYGGWKSIRVTRSIESLAGSFELEASDRWAGQGEPWPIAEEDECRVEIDDQVVITGYIDSRRPALTDTARTLSYSGRDRAAALVDCSAMLGQWTFYGVDLAALARIVAKPFGCPVSVQPGLRLGTSEKIVASPGDTAFAVLERVAKMVGVLLVSDGRGGILITRTGTARATPLIQGQNVKAASLEYDGTERFHLYVVMSQVAAGFDGGSDGGESFVMAEARDEGVRRKERVLIIRPEQVISQADAQRIADWNARVRAARAETGSVTVAGWRQPSGELWAPNTLTRVHVPSIGAVGDMLISKVDYAIGEGGQLTQLRIVRPDAFTPEPFVRAAGAWKELAGGAL